MRKCVNGKMVTCTPEEEARIKKDQAEMTARVKKMRDEYEKKRGKARKRVISKYKLTEAQLDEILAQAKDLI